MEKVVILGNGPASYMATIYVHTANMNPLVVKEETPETYNFKGHDKVVGVTKVKSPKELVEKMEKQIEHFGSRTISKEIEGIEFNSEIELKFGDEIIKTKSVIIDDQMIFERLFKVKRVENDDLELYRKRGIFPCGKIIEDYEEAVVLIGSGCEAAFFVKEFVHE